MIDWIRVADKRPDPDQWYVSVAVATEKDLKTGDLVRKAVMHRGYPGQPVTAGDEIWYPLPWPPIVPRGTGRAR